MNSNIMKNIWIVGDFVPDKKYSIGSALKDLSAQHELKVCNLEGSFLFEGRPALKAGSSLLLDYVSFRDIADNFDLVTQANNHAMDFGAEGLKTTQHLCSLHSIATIGAGKDLNEAFRPFDCGNLRIISVAEHEFGGAGEQSCGIALTEREDIIFDLIREAKSENRYVILIVHGGSEIIPVPPPYLVRKYRMYARYGADLIAGMHPHVVQGYELFQGTHIFYSLGNFAFESETFTGYQNADWSLGLSIDLSTGTVKPYPIVCRDGNINLSENPVFLHELKLLSRCLEDLPALEKIYRSIAQKLLPAWYGRFFPQDAMKGIVDLHHLRCDAHRNLISAGLSAVLGFEEHTEDSEHEVMVAAKDRIWIFDKRNSPLPDLNEYKDRMQMMPEEIVWLESLVKGKNYLEIGAGFSTLYFSQFARHIVSVESRIAWYSTVRSLLLFHSVPNVTLELGPPNSCAYDEAGKERWMRRIHDSGQISDYGTRAEFENYLGVLRRIIFEQNFEVVLVDGQVRYEVMLLLKESGFSGDVLLHDVTEDRKYLNDPIFSISSLKNVEQICSLARLAFVREPVEVINERNSVSSVLLHRTDWLASNAYFYNQKTGKHGPDINSVIDYDNLEIDEEGFNNYLDFGYSVFERTPVRNVRFLPPNAELRQGSDGRLHVSLVEDPVLPWLGKETHLDDVMHRLCLLVRDAETQSEGALVIPTSGGFDSRLLNILISDKTRIHSYSYGTSKKQYDSGEVVKACKLSELLGTKWSWVPITHLNDYLNAWYDAFGVSVHAHGMYQMEFYEKIKTAYPAGTTLYSGIIGDIWAGSTLPEIASERDLWKLGHTHGMRFDPSLSVLACNYEERHNYWLKKKRLLANPAYRVIEMMRHKIILLRYLTIVPSRYGFNVVAPFLDMELALSMLMLPEEYRRDRMWQRVLFDECHVDLESMNLGYETGNFMELDTIRGRTLPPLNERYLTDFLDSRRLVDINRRISSLDFRGGLTDQELIRAYYDYTLLFPVSVLLETARINRRLGGAHVLG